MNKGILLGAVAAMSVCAPAFAADELNYTYLDVGFLRSDLDDLDVDGDGVALQGSYAFTNHVHGFASYANQDFDSTVDATTYEIGAGFRLPLSPKVDLITTGSYINQEVDFDFPFGGKVEDSALGLGLAVRGRVATKLELTGGIKYVNFDDSGDDTALSFGARYFFNDVFALAADVGLDDGDRTYLLGARFNFAKK